MLAMWFALGDLKFEFPPDADEIMIDLKKIVSDDYDTNMKAAKEENEEKKVIQLDIKDAENAEDKADSDDDDDDFPKYEVPEEELVLRKVCLIKEYRYMF